MAARQTLPRTCRLERSALYSAAGTHQAKLRSVDLA